MGLDMYLNARRSFWSHEPQPVVDGHPVNEVKVEAIYWRKSNHTHAWFVDNVQGGVDECQPHYVSREQLQVLRDLCAKAVGERDPTLLEPRGGFFFGSTEINEYYWEDLNRTITEIDRILSSFSDEWYFEYQSSW